MPVRGGAWAIQPPKPPQKPALLRFWLEFPEEAKRNDVTLPPGRVFFTAPVWQEIELERGAEARKEARERHEEAETKSASLADEAVKANPLAKIFGLRKQVLALDEKNAAMRRLERVERYLGGSRDGGAGPFPGLAAGFVDARDDGRPGREADAAHRRRDGARASSGSSRPRRLGWLMNSTTPCTNQGVSCERAAFTYCYGARTSGRREKLLGIP